MASPNNFEINRKPQRKKRWDAILVGAGMIIAFSIVMMRLTGYFSCDIIDALDIINTSCDSWMETNWNSFVQWFSDTIYSRIQIF